MTTRPVNPTVSVQLTPDETRRPTRRAAVIGVAVTLLIAVGAYGAARTLGPDSAPQRAHSAAPSPEVAREMHDVIVHLNGPRAVAAPSPSNTHRDSIMRQLGETTIALYGPRQ